MEESDDLDLEAVLRELEDDEVSEDTELEENEESEEVDESEEDKVNEDEDAEEDEEEVDEEVDKSSGVGKGDNHKGESDQSSVVGSKDKAKHHESVEKTDEVVSESDDEIDLEEVIKALSEEEEVEEEKDKVESLQAELDEHRNVVKYLRTKLNEVNLLNAKLLFTNKLFRSFGLTNEQKMKVVENFDRAHNLREVKLVYSTLAESFGTKKHKTEIKETKGSASKAVASTKSEKQEVIAEGSELRDRFKKLAGIL
jgi:predicted metal-dependent hydrolase